MIHFAQPLWIITGLVFCLLLFIALRAMQKQKMRKLEKFVSPSLKTQLTQNVSNRRRITKMTLYLLAIFCCFLALARPQYGFKWVEVKRKGIDILFALDTSKSMLAEDIKPNRLERSKYAIMDFVTQLEGDRVGVMPFAGSAFLMCPLTIDYTAFEQSLNAIDTEVIPKGGTHLAMAIETAAATLTNDANHKFLILITDGEDLEGDVVEAAQKAAEKHMKIYTIGVGTTEGELIPLAQQGKTGFQKDATGKFITSRLDEVTLTRIAEETGALYVPLGQKGEGLETIYREKLALIPKEEIAERRQKVPLERFEWAVGAALALFSIEFLLNSRRRRPFHFSNPFSALGKISRKKVQTSLFLFLFLIPAMDDAHSSRGEEAFAGGDYISASEYYAEALEKDPENPALHYNYGSAAYKNNLFDEAISSFTTALKSNDLQLQERAYYNRGNSYFKKGEESQQADPQETIKQWREALKSYQASLELEPNAEDAAFNHKLVEKKLEELEKQQEKQKQEGEDQKNKDDQNKKQEENQEKQQDGSDQNSPDQEGQGQEEQNETSEQKEPEGKEGNDTEENSQKGEQPQPPKSSEQEGEDAQAAREQAQADIDAQRREEGKMTKEEAQKLLDGLKDEEGNLNFIPLKQERDDEARRDW